MYRDVIRASGARGTGLPLPCFRKTRPPQSQEPRATPRGILVGPTGKATALCYEVFASVLVCPHFRRSKETTKPRVVVGETSDGANTAVTRAEVAKMADGCKMQPYFILL